MARTRYFDFNNLTKDYFRFLGSQGVTLPSFGVRLLWDNFFETYQGLVPRNLAAYYPSDQNAIILDGSGNINLWSDMSGNSGVNCLCLNGVAGNYASAPDSAAVDVAGDLDLRAWVAADDWTPAAYQMLISKDTGAAAGRSYSLFIQNSSTGRLMLEVSADGTTMKSATSSVAPTVSDFAALWVRATYASASGNILFYTSPDGSTWTQLGTTQSVASGAIANTAASVRIGANGTGGGTNLFAGRIYRAQIYNGIAGTLVFDANFTAVSKLATSFTESSSNAATVTINTSGATGARISGERDLYQGTAASRPAWTAATPVSRGFATFDGTDDYLKSASFSLSQPESVYWVGSQITWSLNDTFYDGNSSGERMALAQVNISPIIRPFAGTSDPTAENGAMTLLTSSIVACVFNGASSRSRVNRGATVVGSIGTNAGNGFMLGASMTPGNFANIITREVAVYSEAHTSAVQNLVINYLSSKFGISL